MQKSFIVGLLLSSLIGLACLCLPTGLAALTRTPTPVPSEPPPTLTAAPTASATVSEYVPVCQRDLIRLLNASINGYNDGESLPDSVTLVTYTVQDGALSDPVYASHLPADLKADQQDTAAQQKLWDFVTAVLPSDWLRMLDHFLVYTDGVNGSLGAVQQTADPYHWSLELDLQDAQNFANLSTTLVHEFGHLLTLNDSQVTPDLPVFDHPQDAQLFDREAAQCPTYFLYEGCSHPDSYINAFYNRFWPSIYPEWKQIDGESDPDQQSRDLDRFYQEYADQFVTNYAASSPEEDIADTFMVFVFKPKPSDWSVADEKVLFFYSYPELVQLRQTLLTNLCSHLNTP